MYLTPYTQVQTAFREPFSNLFDHIYESTYEEYVAPGRTPLTSDLPLYELLLFICLYIIEAPRGGVPPPNVSGVRRVR